MNPIGKWKIREVMHFTLEDGMAWRTPDELAALDVDEDSVRMYRTSVLIFNEDGTAKTLTPLTEGATKEQIDAAIAEGMEITDGMMVTGKNEWKSEDGKVLYKTGTVGEVFGEEVSPWIELNEVDGAIEIELLRYERAE